MIYKNKYNASDSSLQCVNFYADSYDVISLELQIYVLSCTYELQSKIVRYIWKILSDENIVIVTSILNISDCLQGRQKKKNTKQAGRFYSMQWKVDVGLSHAYVASMLYSFVQFHYMILVTTVKWLDPSHGISFLVVAKITTTVTTTIIS